MHTTTPVHAADQRNFITGIKGFLLSIALLCFLWSCSGIPISYYDATTYTNLTALKAESTLLVESFDRKPVAENDEKIDKLVLDLRKAHEYEKGKGDPNSDTAKQFELIVKLVDEDIADYRESGPGALGAKYFREAAIVLGQAFDVAIATENLKNKDKQ